MSDCLLCGALRKEKPKLMPLFLMSKEEKGLCRSCLDGFEALKGDERICTRCCQETEHSICADCLAWEERGEIVVHQALYRYNQQMKDYFLAYKFKGDYLLRYSFSKEIRQALQWYKDYTIVPIPVSQKRLEERGFNQVQGLLEASRIPYQPILRKQHSKRQSELGREARLRQVNPFYIEETNIPGQILLVDDIYTTGATLVAAKKALLKKGAKTIKTFSLSR